MPRFEVMPSSTHVHNALAAIERLQDEGRALWPEGSGNGTRWLRGCTDLWNFINQLGKRRHIDGQDLPTALREFIQAFEHETARMLQMLHSRSGTSDGDSAIERIDRWCELVFRFATYALASSWIDDKTEERLSSIRMSINPTTGQATTWAEHKVTKEMVVPNSLWRKSRIRPGPGAIEFVH